MRIRGGVRHRKGPVRVRDGWNQGWSEASGKDQKLENGPIRNMLPFFSTLIRFQALWSRVEDGHAPQQYKTMFLHFVHLRRNGHFKRYASAPGWVTVAMRLVVSFQYTRIYKQQASIWAQSFSVTQENCFPLEPCHWVLWSQVSKMEIFTVLFTVSQRKSRTITYPLEVDRTGQMLLWKKFVFYVSDEIWLFAYVCAHF